MKQAIGISQRRGITIIVIGAAALFFIALPSLAGALGKSSGGLQSWIEVTGILRQVGNAPFIDLVISCPDGTEWYIDKDDTERLAGTVKSLISKLVIVHGEPYTIELILANNQHIGTRSLLRNITSLRAAVTNNND